MLLSDVCLMPVLRLTSIVYIGNNSRTERPRKTKIGTQVAHVRYTCLGHHFQGQKLKGQGHQAGLLTTAFTHRQMQRSTWERIERGKLLLRCRLQARRSTWRREGLRRPHGEERGGGILCRHAHSLFFIEVKAPPFAFFDPDKFATSWMKNGRHSAKMY